MCLTFPSNTSSPWPVAFRQSLFSYWKSSICSEKGVHPHSNKKYLGQPDTQFSYFSEGLYSDLFVNLYFDMPDRVSGFLIAVFLVAVWGGVCTLESLSMPGDQFLYWGINFFTGEPISVLGNPCLY